MSNLDRGLEISARFSIQAGAKEGTIPILGPTIFIFYKNFQKRIMVHIGLSN